MKEGTLTLDIDGTEEVFNVLVEYEYSEGKYYLHLKREYRLWYGYPAQVGLVAAIPIDLALNIVGVATAIVAAPIAYVLFEVIPSEK